MFEKINEIKASEWIKTLTDEQFDKQVVLRDNWGNAIVSGELRTMIKNSWIKPEDNIDIDKTDIANGNSVYFGTVPTKYIDADKLWNNKPRVPDGKSQDYMAGFIECMWDFRKLIQESHTADVILKSEYDRLEKLYNDMTQEAKGYLNRLYGIRADVAREIFEEIDRYIIRGISVNGEHLTLFNGKSYAELKKKYTEEKE